MARVPQVQAKPKAQAGNPFERYASEPEPGLRAAVTAASAMDPDGRAEELRIAKERGLSPDAVHAVFEQGDALERRRLSGNPFNRLLDGSRATQAWFSDPNNAAIAQDDIDPILGMTSALRGFNRRQSWFGDVGSATATGFTGLRAGYGHLAIALGANAPEYMVDLIAKANRAVADSQERMSHGTRLYKQRLERASTLGVIPTALSDPAGLAVLVAENLGFSAPSMGGAIAGGLAAGPVGAGVGAFAMGTATEFGAWVNQEIGAAGYDITDPDQLLAAYRNPALIERVQAEALRKGLGTSAVDALSVFVGGKAVAKAARGWGKAKAVGRELATQSAMETAGEAVGQAAAVGEVDWRDAMLEGVASLGQSGGEIALGASMRRMGEAVQAQQDASTVRKAVEELSKSKAFRRLPDATRALIAAEVADQNSEVRTAYIDKATWDSFWRERGENPQEAAGRLFGAEGLGRMRYREAGQQGFLAVPLEVWTQAAVDDPQRDQMIDMARYRADGMTLAEVRAELDAGTAGSPELVQDMQAELGRATRLFQSEDALRAEAATLDEQIAALESEDAGTGEDGEAGGVDRPVSAEEGAGPGVDAPVGEPAPAGGAAQEPATPAQGAQATAGGAEAVQRLEALRQRRAEVQGQLEAIERTREAEPVRDQIRAGAVEQLVAAGRGQAEAELLAQPFVRAYEVIAERAGMTLEALWERFPVMFRRANAHRAPLPGKWTTLSQDDSFEALDLRVLRARRELSRLRRLPVGKKQRQAERRASDIELAREAVDQAQRDLETAYPDYETRRATALADRRARDAAASDREAALAEREIAAQPHINSMRRKAQVGLRGLGYKLVRSSGGSNYYAMPGRRQVRISDHAVPLTTEREAISQAGGFTWADGGVQLILSADTSEAEVDAFLQMVDKEPPSATAGGAVRAVQDAFQRLFHPAYHGSPHRFEQFSLHAIGTGEGAQAYGWGLYFAESREIAEYYRNTLAGRDFYLDGQQITRGAELLVDDAKAVAYRLQELPRDLRPGGEADAIRAAAQNKREHADFLLKAYGEDSRPQAELQRLQADMLDSVADRVRVEMGTLYEVDLAPEQDEYLDWDKPLSEQSEKVKAALRSGRSNLADLEMARDAAQEHLEASRAPFDPSMSEESVRRQAAETAAFMELQAAQAALDDAKRAQKMLAGVFTDDARRGVTAARFYERLVATARSARAASEALAAAGIPGIRYLDGSSRGKGEGSYNYVIFDDRLVTITRMEQNAAPDTIDVDGTERPTRNSDGNLIHPTEEGVRAFWRWFEDSRVVDDEGRPLVVYHGTTEAAAAGLSDAGPRSTLFVTADPDVAAHYAGGSATLPLYVKASNSLQVSTARDIAEYLRDEGVLSEDAVAFMDGDPDAYVTGRERRVAMALGGGRYTWEALEDSDVVALLREAGVDAVWNEQDFMGDGSSPDDAHDSLAVLSNAQVKSAIGNAGTFDPSDRSILRMGANRGAVEFGPPDDQGRRQFDVQFYSRANRATFFHEMGHVFLEMLGDLAGDEGAPTQLRDDYAAVLAWLGVESRDQIETEHHEKFARGFEAYIREGKAPSSALRRAFAAFKDWMLRIYRDLLRLNVELTDDVRGVMDRLLATDAEIAEAQYEVGAPIMPAEALAEMGDDERASYMSAAKEAEDESREELARREFESIAQQQKAERSERMDALKRQERDRFNERPGVKAHDAMVAGDFPKVAVETVSAEERAVLEPLGLLTDEDGVTLDNVAEEFGVTVDVLLTQVGEVADRDRRIERAAQRRLRDEFPELLGTRSVRATARRAVANAERAKLLDRERLWLWRQALRWQSRAGREAAGRRADNQARREAMAPESAAQIREIARNMIAGMAYSDIKPHVYLRAAQRESRRAADRVRVADWMAASTAKRLEQINLELYRAGMQAREQAAKDEARLRKLGTASYRERATKGGPNGKEHREQIAKLQQRFKIPHDGEPAQPSGSLAEFAAALEAEGNPVAIPEWMAREGDETPWQRLTPEQIHDLRQVADAFYKIARDRDAMLTGDRRRQRTEMALEAAAAVRASRPARPLVTGGESDRERFMERLDAWLANGTKASIYARMMDGDADGGPVHNAIIRPINEAMDRKAIIQREALEAVHALYDEHFTKDERRRMDRRANFAGVELSHQDRLSILAHLGNVEGRQRLSQILTAEQLRAVMASYTAADVAWVRGLWAMYQGYFEQATALHERISGQTPKPVQHVPFTLRIDGEAVELPGGYMPIAYKDSRPWREQTQDWAAQIHGSAPASALIDMGFLQKRQDKVRGRLRLDQGVIVKHVMDITHMLTMREAVLDVQAILGNDELHGAIQEHYGKAVTTWLKDWLKTVAAETGAPRNATEDALATLRQRTVTATLGFRVKSALMQLFGLRQTAVRVGGKWMAIGLRRWMFDRTTAYKTGEWIASKSPFMAERPRGTFQRELNELRNRLPFRFQTNANLFAFWMLTKTQYAVDQITWLAQYEKSMHAHRGASSIEAAEAQAIADADQAVRDSQGGGQIHDMSWWESGPPAIRLLTTYFTEASLKFNLTRLSLSRTKWQDPGSWPRFLADMTLLYFVEAGVVGALMALSGDEDDEEIRERMSRKVVAAALDTMPVLREFAGVAQGYPYRGPAGTAAVGHVIAALQQIGQGEMDPAFWRSVNMAGGSIFGYPARAINDVGDAISQVLEGESPTALVGIRPD